VGSPKLKKAKTPGEAARNGYEFYKQLQSSDGHFATEYGGTLINFN
jgi:lanosterol synthase